MPRFSKLFIAIFAGLGLLSPSCLAHDVSLSKTNIDFPALSKGSSRPAAGRSVLPFMISLAQHPELLQPPYLRLILGTPDRAKPFAYPTNTFSWTPEDGSKVFYMLTRNTDARPPAGGETRQLVTKFKQSKITQKSVRSRLGKPIRRFFDNQGFPVEVFQITPLTTLSVTEPTNSFDVSQITVNYSGPYLPQVSRQDTARAEFHRMQQIDHHLSKGNRDRGLSLLLEHVTDNPGDIEAHLVLAEALKNRCDVNGAIAEYRRALALAQGSGDLVMQKRAMDGLAPMGLVPPGAPVTRALSLKDAAKGGFLPQ